MRESNTCQMRATDEVTLFTCSTPITPPVPTYTQAFCVKKVKTVPKATYVSNILPKDVMCPTHTYIHTHHHQPHTCGKQSLERQTPPSTVKIISMIHHAEASETSAIPKDLRPFSMPSIGLVHPPHRPGTKGASDDRTATRPTFASLKVTLSEKGKLARNEEFSECIQLSSHLLGVCRGASRNNSADISIKHKLSQISMKRTWEFPGNACASPSRA